MVSLLFINFEINKQLDQILHMRIESLTSSEKNWFVHWIAIVLAKKRCHTFVKTDFGDYHLFKL